MLFTHYSKTLLTNRALWGWGVLFMVFWLIIGGFVESTGLPKGNHMVALSYTASWYGLINLFSLSSLAISIAFSLIYSTHSLAYSFRYTRLKPSSYLVNLVASSLIMGVILSVLMLVSTYAIFSYKLGAGVAPANPALTLPIAALSGVFMYAFATLLVLILINSLGLKNQSFVSFIPLLLGYVFGFLQLFLSLPSLVIYASPLSAIQDLLYYAYSGQPVPSVLSNPSSQTLRTPYLTVSLVAWTLVLLVADSILLRKIKPRSIEEARQI
ncbi:hypothetical protein B9Q03_08385 [Candidatus Marsarchaeota G2 archaeon OSP_D]|jgi:hypothetical protein|uniref:ABC-2 type transporter domain-containing protein n=2 Tax=Candidatus Marsarchaeota group 2 TaxID=2203771 RepID=A0A2R6B5Z0_9ARCH|nr:MAG: hypothetical protein B9Q03_08385 [Candidatus Marsarchaeota G2 archaeon OSP_D]PSN94061.1 MAG: hypothetical protein B9Q09_04595 [Candidatus Marsarchaeota G2 archaeon ECH_B_SAG-C16]